MSNRLQMACGKPERHPCERDGGWGTQESTLTSHRRTGAGFATPAAQWHGWSARTRPSPRGESPPWHSRGLAQAIRCRIWVAIGSDAPSSGQGCACPTGIVVGSAISGLNSWSSSWDHCMADLRWRAAAAQGERNLGEVCKKGSEAGAQGRSRHRRQSLAPSAHYAVGCGALWAGGVGVSMPPQERGTAAMTRPAPFVSASSKGRTHGSLRLHGMRGLWREFRGWAWTSDRNRGAQRVVVSKSVRAIGDRIPRALPLGRVIAAPRWDGPLVG
jgi:hypothetical protein